MIRRTSLALLAALALAPAAAQADTSLSGPSGTTTDATPTFTFGSSEPGTFECRADDAPFAACTSPWTIGLADGPHTVQVRAVDEAGNADPTPATRSFTVDTSGIDTTIDAGPEGLTNDPTPSFGFGSTITGATYECRIAGPAAPDAAFAACASPYTPPALRSGSHVFEVRAVTPADRRDPTPARRAFVLDADAPDTVLTGGPAEGATTGERRPAFTYAAEAGARFECRVDPVTKEGVELVDWAACGAAGFRPSRDLSGGPHVLEVRAVDAAGNADPSPARRAFRVQACETVVRFGLIEARGACLEPTGTEEAPRWVSEGDITLNGLPVPAPGAAKVVLTQGAGGAGTLSVDDVELWVAGVRLYRGNLRLALPAGGAGQEKEVAALDLGVGQKLFGLGVDGDASLRLGRRSGTDERYGVLTLHVELPGVLRTGPSQSSGGVTGDVGIRMTPSEGVILDGLKIAVNNAYVGAIGVRRLCLSYLRAGATFITGCQAPSLGSGEPKPFITCQEDTSVDRWDGALALVLPTPSQTELGLWGGMAGGKLSHAGAFADRLGTLVPIAPGVFLDRVGIGLCLSPPPFKVKGEAAVAFGPDWGGKKAVLVSGWMQYTDAYAGQPWRIDAGGSLSLFDHGMAEASMSYLSSGLAEFGFRAGFRWDGLASVEGKVAGWAETQGERRFNVRGDVSVCVEGAGCAGGSAVVSDIGVAGCLTVDLVSIPVFEHVGPDWDDWAWVTRKVQLTGGAGYRFADEDLRVMIGSCDIGAYERQLTARGAQAGLPAPLSVVDGQRALVVRLRGDGAVPRVALVGPDGRRVLVADGAPGLVRGSHMLAVDRRGHTITAMVSRPAKGTWRVEPLPDSAGITATDVARDRPEPAVGGEVTGRGHRRVLRYAYRPQPGQRIVLTERGARTGRALPEGRTVRCPRTLAARGLRCARVAFAPARGGAGKRRIEAQVVQDGLPRDAVTVATFTAPADRVAARPRLKVQRRPGAVRVSWRRVANATKVNVVLRTTDGRRVLFTRSAKAGAVRLAGVKAATGVIVTARGMRSDAVEGRPASVRLRPKRTAPRRTTPVRTPTKRPSRRTR